MSAIPVAYTTPSPGKWTAAANCANTDPESFFPDKGGSTRAAKRVCARCPVRRPCLEYALAERIDDGVWGGLSPLQRAAIRRERGQHRIPRPRQRRAA